MEKKLKVQKICLYIGLAYAVLLLVIDSLIHVDLMKAIASIKIASLLLFAPSLVLLLRNAISGWYSFYRNGKQAKTIVIYALVSLILFIFVFALAATMQISLDYYAK